MPRLQHKDITGRIIGAALRVHRILGPGFLESIYEEAMAVELGTRGLEFRRQVAVPVEYDGHRIGRHRLDLLVEDRIVVELKAVRALEPVHHAILMSYLKATNRRVGLLLNFRAVSLAPKRLLNPAAPD